LGARKSTSLKKVEEDFRLNYVHESFDNVTERASTEITTKRRSAEEERGLTKAEEQRVNSHAVDAEEDACDDVRRDHDDLQATKHAPL